MAEGGQLAIFRCDASPKIGTGHVSRCVALAEALVEVGWRCIFAVNSDAAAKVSTEMLSGFEVLHLACRREHEPGEMGARVSGDADLLVVDHYEWDDLLQRACRGWASRIVVMDDGTGRDHDCDVLIDAATDSAEAYEEHVPSGAKLLVGPEYALLRRTFLKCRQAALARRDGRPVENVLIAFGGTDTANLTPRALEAVAADALGNALVTVALSSHVGNLDELKLGPRVRLVFDSTDLAPLMAEADLAIGAAGVMAYERASLGLPSVFAVVAENQRGIGRLIEQAGAGRDAGRIDGEFPRRVAELSREIVADKNLRRRMAQAGSTLVDGAGPARIMRVVA